MKGEKTRKGNSVEVSIIPDPVKQVTLHLNYNYHCGDLCCYSIDRLKTVIFNASGEIVSLYMPNYSETMC